MTNFFKQYPYKKQNILNIWPLFGHFWDNCRAAIFTRPLLSYAAEESACWEHMKNLTKGPYKKFQIQEYRREGSFPEGDALLSDADWIAAGSPLLFHADLKVRTLKEERR
jgi:hypothetical protein